MRYLKTTLTVIGAVTVLVLAGNTVALATTGHALLLGKSNTANTITSISRTTAGTALAVKTKTSLSPPLKVNGVGKVTNLNADRVDGKNAADFAPYPKVIRGTWSMATSGNPEFMAADISFGWTLPSAPVTHFIESGAPVPAGCAGTAAAPSAEPGNLCVFVTHLFGSVGVHGICNHANVCDPGADTYGAVIYGTGTGASGTQISGTWAVRAASVSASPRIATGANRTSTHARTASGR